MLGFTKRYQDHPTCVKVAGSLRGVGGNKCQSQQEAEYNASPLSHYYVCKEQKDDNSVVLQSFSLDDPPGRAFNRGVGVFKIADT
jgi:hypothetical protein